MEWKNVYLFISSTFNDMHAERDYLVKKVFPELRIWCSQRKLKFLDIDLRWGISEADAQQNKRVVDVCMQNIDKCRPFFLGLIGQRRGWVPGIEDISVDTLKNYPGLKDFIGKHSITELEIIHGLKHPLDEKSASIRHAIFFFRDPSYLQDIKDDKVRLLFAPESLSTQKNSWLNRGRLHHLFRQTTHHSSSDLESFKASLAEQYQVVIYQADWNADAISPELKRMNGKDLSHGRLEHFRVGNKTLREVVLAEMKQIISEEFPEHMTVWEPETVLEKEQNAQAAVLFQACDSYIERPVEQAKIKEYLRGDETYPYILYAKAGNGKTSLLAHIIQTYEGDSALFYRFVGTTEESVDMERTLTLLVRELCVRGFITEKEEQEACRDITGHLLEILGKAARKKKIVLILDSIDQWIRLDQHLTWLSRCLPAHVKLILSLRQGASRELETHLQNFGIPLQELPGITDEACKQAMIRYYLGQFLKDVDEQQLEKIIALPGSSNPLYLKIVLNELRMFGSFEQLWEKLNTDYGDTPEQAFAQILVRLENESYGESVSTQKLTEIVLAMMSCAQEAFRIADFVPVFRREGITDPNDEEILDDIQVLLHHLDTYLVMDGEKVDFRYDSFRRAAKDRYAAYPKKDKWHSYLTEIYEARCLKDRHHEKEPDLRKNLIFLGNHALQSSTDVSSHYFQNAQYLYYLLRESGPDLTAEYLKREDKRGTLSPYIGKIADLILSHSAALFVNAGYLFYLFSQESEENPIIDQMLKEACSLHCRYLVPSKRQQVIKTGSFAPYRESAFPADGIRRQVYVAGDYLVYVLSHSWEAHEQGEKDSVSLRRLTDEQEVFHFYAPGDIMQSQVDGQFLYLQYLVQISEREYAVYFEVLTLPDFQSVCKTRGIAQEIADYCGNRWSAFGYAGAWYLRADAKGKGFRIYLISESRLLWERNYAQEELLFDSDGEPGLISYQVKGRFVLEHFYEGHLSIVWDVLTGEKIDQFREQTISFCSDEKELFIFHRTRERKQMVKRFSIQESYTGLEEEKELPAGVGGSEAVLGEGYLLTFGITNDVTILSRSDLQVLGVSANGLGGHPCLQRVVLHGRDILYITKQKIRRFRKQDLIGRFEAKEGKNIAAINRQILEHQGVIYDMASPVVMLDTRSYTRTEIFCDHIYQYSSFSHMGEEDYLVGYASLEQKPGSYMAILQKVPTMEMCMALPFELPTACAIKGIGYHDRSFMVITGPKGIMESSLSLPSPTASDPDRTILLQKLDLYCFNVSIDGRKLLKTQQLALLGQWQLVSLPDMMTYLVVDNIYVDEYTLASRIYKMTGEIVWERQYAGSNLLLKPVVPSGGSSIYYMEHLSDGQQMRKWQNVLVEIDLQNMAYSSYPVGYDHQYLMKIVGCNEKELILSPATHQTFFCIFDREKKTITKTIWTNCSEKLYGVIHKQDCYLCQFLHTDIWRVYSEEGEDLFSQLMPEEMDYYNDTSLQGDLCMIKSATNQKKTPVLYRIACPEER